MESSPNMRLFRVATAIAMRAFSLLQIRLSVWKELPLISSSRDSSVTRMVHIAKNGSEPNTSQRG